jgi:hypothetical protein
MAATRTASQPTASQSFRSESGGRVDREWRSHQPATEQDSPWSELSPLVANNQVMTFCQSESM